MKPEFCCTEFSPLTLLNALVQSNFSFFKLCAWCFTCGSCWPEFNSETLFIATFVREFAIRHHDNLSDFFVQFLSETQFVLWSGQVTGSPVQNIEYCLLGMTYASITVNWHKGASNFRWYILSILEFMLGLTVRGAGGCFYCHQVTKQIWHPWWDGITVCWLISGTPQTFHYRDKQCSCSHLFRFLAWNRQFKQRKVLTRWRCQHNTKTLSQPEFPTLCKFLIYRRIYPGLIWAFSNRFCILQCFD